MEEKVNHLSWIVPKYEDLEALLKSLEESVAYDMSVNGNKFDKNVFILMHITSLVMKARKSANDEIKIYFVHIHKKFTKEFHKQCKKLWNVSIRPKDFWNIINTLMVSGAMFKIETMGSESYGVNYDISVRLLADFNNWVISKAEKEKKDSEENDDDTTESDVGDTGQD